DVIVVAERHQPRVRDAGRNRSPERERDRRVALRVQHERGLRHEREPLSDVERLKRAIELRREVGARGPALQLVEPVALLLGRVRNEQRSEELTKRRIAMAPARLDQTLERFPLRARYEGAARERAAQNQTAHAL